MRAFVLRLVHLTIMTVALAALGLSSPGCTDDDNGDGKPVICPIDGKCGSAGMTYDELVTAWVKWFVSIPMWNHPILDTDGKHCHVGQTAAGVWFLGGTTSSGTPVKRSCTVPADRGLFFPILNGQCNACKPCEDCGLQGLKPSECVGEDQSETHLKTCIKGFGDLVTSMEAKVDGKEAAPDLKSFEVIPPILSAKGVDDDRHRWIPCSKGDRKYAAVGYYLFVNPLKAGKHTISFKGAMTGGFSLDVQYDLDVQDKPTSPDLGPSPDIASPEAGPQCPPGGDASADQSAGDQQVADQTASE